MWYLVKAYNVVQDYDEYDGRFAGTKSVLREEVEVKGKREALKKKKELESDTVFGNKRYSHVTVETKPIRVA